MAKVWTLSEVCDAAKGDHVSAVKAVLKALHKHENKPGGQYGPYTQQDGVLKDGNVEIKVTFRNWDPVGDTYPGVVGKMIYLEAGHDAKGKQSGLEADHWTGDDGKERKVLKVGKYASLTLADTGARRAEPPVQQELGPTSQTAPAASPSAAVIAAKRFLGQQANAMALCLRAANKVAGDVVGAVELDKDDIRHIATTFFIEGSKRSQFDGVPYGALPDTKAPTSPPPPPPKPIPAPPTNTEPDIGDDVPF